jgi:NAD(P)-dependent dehydrogenase (short-subunit alcohol dehydrogenase family)/predicted dehydrogenase
MQREVARGPRIGARGFLPVSRESGIPQIMPELDFGFKDKLAVVTGGAHGIGFAAARLLAAQGASVYIFDLVRANPREAARRIGVRACATDVADRESIESALRTSGTPDILIANAGTASEAEFCEHTREEWDRILAVNLSGAFHTLQAAACLMKQRRGGAIVLTASTNSYDGEARLAAYNASKAGLLGLVHTAANELGPYGIRVNAVCPGLIRTRLTENQFNNPEILRNYFRHIPLGRGGEPDEVAHAIAFLANGFQVRHVDGRHRGVPGWPLAAALVGDGKTRGKEMNGKLNVAIVGLGFGKEFIPIYRQHPLTNMYAICQRTREKLDEVGAQFGVARRYTDFEELIGDPNVDAVHINSPIHLHAPQSIAALKAGKHVACTVPAATSVEECREIVRAAESSGKNYMMMETAIYTREFLFIRELRDSGKLGRIQFMRGCHQQEMAGWPGYWEGLPPMHYATHAVSPCLAIVKGEAAQVSCLGSGSIAPNLAAKYGSPFAVETAIFQVRNQQLAFEATRSLFETARQYIESIDVYGDKMSFEWTQIEGEKPVLHIGEKPERVEAPDYAHLLPEPIRRFTRRGVYDEEHAHLSFIQGGGHGGSHPHLVHEFVSSVVEGRPAFPDVYQSVNWTCAGICAHESAMRCGEPVKLPQFTTAG